MIELHGVLRRCEVLDLMNRLNQLTDWIIDLIDPNDPIVLFDPIDPISQIDPIG